MTTEYRFFTFEALEARDGGPSILKGVMPYGAEARIAQDVHRSVRGGRSPWGTATAMSSSTSTMIGRQPLARTNGGGLVLTDTPEALRIEAEIPAYRGDVADMLKRRILRGISVEMLVDEEAWTGDRREIIKARLPGLALVDRPAYSGASAELAARARYGITTWPLVL